MTAEIHMAYTYYIRWIRLNLRYYGGRCANQIKCRHPEDDLWQHYFTSSDRVREIRETHGEPDIILIHRRFAESAEMWEFERRMLEKLDVTYNDGWINESDRFGPKQARRIGYDDACRVYDLRVGEGLSFERIAERTGIDFHLVRSAITGIGSYIGFRERYEKETGSRIDTEPVSTAAVDRDTAFEIYRLRNRRFTLSRIAKKFKIDRNVARSVCSGENCYAEYLMEYESEHGPVYRIDRTGSVDSVTARSILSMYGNGDIPLDEIAEKNETTVPVVKKVGQGHPPYDRIRAEYESEHGEVVRGRARKVGRDDAFRILDMRRDGLLQRQIAENTGISYRTVRNVCEGKHSYGAWKSEYEAEHGTVGGMGGLGRDTIWEILDLCGQGIAAAEIADRFGIGASTVSRIRQGDGCHAGIRAEWSAVDGNEMRGRKQSPGVDETTARRIFDMDADGIPQSQIMRELDLGRPVVYNVRHGRGKYGEMRRDWEQARGV